MTSDARCSFEIEWPIGRIFAKVAHMGQHQARALKMSDVIGMGANLAPSLGGREKLSRSTFSNDVFLGKISILTRKISDHLF